MRRFLWSKEGHAEVRQERRRDQIEDGNDQRQAEQILGGPDDRTVRGDEERDGDDARHAAARQAIDSRLNGGPLGHAERDLDGALRA